MEHPDGEPLPIDPEPPAARGSIRHRSLGMLAWIAAYKLLKAAGATAGGILALRLVNRDLMKVGLRWIEQLRLDPQGSIAGPFLHWLERFQTHSVGRLQIIALILFLYAVIYIIEGIGLFGERRWAEWLTAVQTALLIPLEIYEVARGFSALKSIALFINLLIVAYLLWRIRVDRRRPRLL